LRHDLDWLGRLGFTVVTAPGHRYSLTQVNPRFPLPLTREQVEALAAARRAFAQTPYHKPMNSLVERLRPFLAPAMRTALEREPMLRVEIPLLDHAPPSEEVLRKFRRAASEQRRFSFTYRSPAGGKSRRHTIEPEALEEREGHIYFEGYSPDYGQVLQFRLERVDAASAEVLPTRFAARRRRATPIRYRLSPTVARFGATHRFPNHTETALPDGWVEVSAETRDLFWAGKILLKYGEHCVVLEPSELVKEMRRVVTLMAQNYGLEL
jgi:predicted DNA-binding transcriptional regulator YafY